LGPAADATAIADSAPGARPAPLDVVVLGFGLVLAVALRAVLLPTVGLRSDLNIFATWTHWIATNPLGAAYRIDLAFPPVMAYVFWALGVVQPAFRTATDATDQVVRIALKVPAVLADAGLVAGVAYLLRGQPRWGIAAALGVALSPVVIYSSAWWGQFESVYVLAGLAAAILAIGGRPYLAAVALGVALMAKPQAAAFVPPFAAWMVARHGWRRGAKIGLVVGATAAILWLPFLADGGPAAYLRTLGRVQTEIFAFLSLRAWNPWWIVQASLGGGDFVGDGGAILGPLSSRIVGYVLVAIIEMAVVRMVFRSPTNRTLLLGLAASVLVCFELLTSVHERYAYGAIIFLAPLIRDRRALATWLALTGVMTLNVLAAVPPTPEIGAVLPIGGLLGIAGSIAMIGLTGATLWLLPREPAEGLGASSHGEWPASVPTTRTLSSAPP
jgi:Gpi18-like mannosyltransferase